MSKAGEAPAAEVDEAAADKAAVLIDVPAEARSLRVVRLAASAVAGDAGVGLDGIEDLRVAVDEACAVLIEHAEDGARLAVRLVPGDRSVEVSGRCEVRSVPSLHPVAAEILAMLADGFELEELHSAGPQGASLWHFRLRTHAPVGAQP